MTYEAICSTTRAAAAVTNVAYVPHNMPEYLALIDRPAHLAHVAAVAAVVTAGHGMPPAISYSEFSQTPKTNSKTHSILMLLLCAGMLFTLVLGQLISMRHRLLKLQAVSLL